MIGSPVTTPELPWTFATGSEKLTAPGGPLADVAMTAFLCCCSRAFRVGRWRLAAALLLIGLSGCASWKLHDDGFRDNDLSQSARKARSEKSDKSKDKDIDYGSLSEKGRQVERDLHAM
jgi:hypothetical protein